MDLDYTDYMIRTVKFTSFKELKHFASIHNVAFFVRAIKNGEMYVQIVTAKSKHRILSKDHAI